MKPISVGVIGLGAIGSRLVEALVKEFQRIARVEFLCELRKDRIREIQRRYVPKTRAVSWASLVDQSDLVIEAASQKIALPVARRALQQGKQVLILSVGGFLAGNGLPQLLQKTKGRLWIPSGALAGIDSLLAAREGKLHAVTLITRKPVRSLEETAYLRKKKIRLSEIREPTLLFDGEARQAIRAFPKNVNVAATLALAGLGPRKTRVKIYASPTYDRNQHEVLIEGDFGRIRTQVENLPMPANPRTSELAVLSAKAMLRKIFTHLQIGT